LAIFLGSAFPASRVQHISDLNSKFALTTRVEVGCGRQLSNLRRLRFGEEKEKKKKIEEETMGQKYNGLPYSYYLGRP